MSEWSEWIEHDGKGCPVLGQVVQMVFASLDVIEGVAGAQGGLSWDWRNSDWVDVILRYRYRQYPAARDLIRLAEHVREDA